MASLPVCHFQVLVSFAASCFASELSCEPKQLHFGGPLDLRSLQTAKLVSIPLMAAVQSMFMKAQAVCSSQVAMSATVASLRLSGGQESFVMSHSRKCSCNRCRSRRLSCASSLGSSAGC